MNKSMLVGMGFSVVAIFGIAVVAGLFNRSPQFAQVLSAIPIKETLKTARQTCSTGQICQTIYDKQERMLGYNVTYKIGDQQGKIRMESDPGIRIPLDNNGRLVLSNKA